MSTRKLVTRLNKLVTEFEARGIGVGFCSCSNPEIFRARKVLMDKIFPELDFIGEPEQRCENHKPRPVRKPRVESPILRIFHEFAEEPDEDLGNASFADLLQSYPLETRLDAFFGVKEEVREPKQLKPSMFDISEYQLEN